jgi:hypothetical protein
MRTPLTRRCTPPAVLLAAAAAVVVSTPVSRASAQEGVTFTYRVQNSSAKRDAKAQGESAPDMLATVKAAGANMRLEFEEGSMPGMKAGGYMLIRGSDQTFVIVNTKDKAAIVMDAAGLGSGAGSMTNNALVKVSQRDPKFDFQDLGAGEKILGYNTRHVRFTSSGTTEMRVMGRTNKSTESTVGDSWIATKLPGVDPEALRSWGQAFGRGMRRTNADLVPRLADYEKQYGQGIALRTVMVAASTDDKGRERTDTLRMEVTQLSSGRLDKSLFEIPADYQIADMRQMAAALDSAKRASGLDTFNMKGAMKEAGKDGAKDAVKGALGGFLKRKRP